MTISCQRSAFSRQEKSLKNRLMLTAIGYSFHLEPRGFRM